MKKLSVLLLLFSVAVFAAAPKKFTNDVLQFGSSATSAVKELIFEVGDGASNPKIGVDTTNKDFDFSTNVNVDGDILSLGDGTASDKELSFDIGQGASNPKLFWDNAAGALSFTNDGTLIKKIGSGSGAGGAGGINLLLNSSFEDPGTPILNWTASGGTLTQEDLTNGREANLKFARFVATTAAQYIESDPVTVSDDVGFGCMADTYYTQGDNAFTLKVLKEDLPTNPGTFNEVASQGFSDLTSFLKLPTVTFDCEGGDVFKLRFESTGAGTLDLDLAYLGSNKNINPQGKSASFVGSIAWAPTTNCLWESASTSPGAFNLDADCVVESVNGKAIDISSGDSPVIRFASLKKGQYKVVYEGEMGKQVSSANSTISFQTRFQDGSNTYNSSIQGFRGAQASGVEIRGPVLSFNVNIPTNMSNVDINLLGASNSGGADPATVLVATNGFKISVYYYPTDQETQEAFAPEQANFTKKDAILYTSNAVAITHSNGTFSQIVVGVNGVLEGEGFSELCTSAEQPVGGNCLTSTVFGFRYNIPLAGRVEVCASAIGDGNGQVYANKLVMVSNSDSGTIVQDKTAHSGGNSSNWDGFKICEIFEIPSVGEYSFAVYAATSGTTTYRISNSAGAGVSDQATARFSISPVVHDVATPRLLNQVSTRARYGSEKGACHFINTGASLTFDTSDPDCWFAQATGFFGNGEVQITFVESGLKCSLSSIDTNLSFLTMREDGGSSISAASLPQIVRVISQNQGGTFGLNVNFSLLCSKNK